MKLEIIDPETNVAYPSIEHGGRVCYAISAGHKFAGRSDPGESGRHEHVMAVDGRDTLNNEPGSATAKGVVTSGRYTCKGIRISDTEVRGFVCGVLGDGVTTAERNDSTSSAGMVSVAIYREKRDRILRASQAVVSVVMDWGREHIPAMPRKLMGADVLACATPTDAAEIATSSTAAPVFRSGPTAGAIAGAVVEDVVGRTEWKRGELLGEQVVEYDTPEGWAARGVSFARLGRNPWPADAPKYADPQKL